MTPPTLRDLPPPPPEKSGWPWTTGGDGPLPPRRPDGSPWPRITIVTPSWNQGSYIEETIRSVLLQGYPELEYIVMDGGSSDGTVEILKRYEPWVAHWESAPDRGQSHAINRGMEHAAGEITAWLNSDDVYLPGALRRVALAWEPGRTDWLVGRVKKGPSLLSPETRPREAASVGSALEIAGFWLLRDPSIRTIVQPECFVSLRAWKDVGGLNEDLSLVMDYHLWARLAAAGYRPRSVDEILAFFRVHEAQVTSPDDLDYRVRRDGERAWSLHDAVREARKRGNEDDDWTRLRKLLDNRMGGAVRVLDVVRRGGGPLRLAAATAAAAVIRPRTTLRGAPRIIVREAFRQARRGTG